MEMSTMYKNGTAKAGGMNIVSYLKNNALPILVLILQLVLMFLVINPINVLNNLEVVSVINEVGKKTPLPPNEVPVVAVIGDKKNLGTIEEIQKGNEIDKVVYKDAANGDYVLGYTNKLVIYRKNSSTVIYDKESPRQLLATSQTNLVNLVLDAAKIAKIVDANYQTQPTISIVTVPDDLKKVNAFYKDVQKDDIVATFNDLNSVMIYRPSTKAVVNSGKLNVEIK
jgi:hypothetical protein